MHGFFRIIGIFLILGLSIQAMDRKESSVKTKSLFMDLPLNQQIAFIKMLDPNIFPHSHACDFTNKDQLDAQYALALALKKDCRKLKEARLQEMLLGKTFNLGSDNNCELLMNAATMADTSLDDHE